MLGLFVIVSVPRLISLSTSWRLSAYVYVTPLAEAISLSLLCGPLRRPHPPSPPFLMRGGGLETYLISPRATLERNWSWGFSERPRLFFWARPTPPRAPRPQGAGALGEVVRGTSRRGRQQEVEGVPSGAAAPPVLPRRPVRLPGAGPPSCPLYTPRAPSPRAGPSRVAPVRALGSEPPGP